MEVLVEEKKGLQGEINSLTGNIEGLNKKMVEEGNKYGTSLATLQNSLKNKDQVLQNSEVVLKEKDGLLKGLRDRILNKEMVSDELNINISNLMQEKSNLVTQRNTGFGGIGVLSGGLLVWFLRRKATQFIERGRAKIQAKEDRLVDVLRGFVQGKEDALVDKILDKIHGKDIDPRKEEGEDEKKNIIINNQNICVPKNKEWVLNDWCDHKKSCGHDIEQLGLFAELYKEAINELRRGKLFYEGRVVLQGQKKIADALDAWVEKMFVENLTKEDLKEKGPFGKIRLNAMIGFLYQEAVGKLRRGEFPVLNAKAAADAIDLWVNKELTRRLGVNIGRNQ